MRCPGPSKLEPINLALAGVKTNYGEPPGRNRELEAGEAEQLGVNLLGLGLGRLLEALVLRIQLVVKRVSRTPKHARDLCGVASQLGQAC